MIVVRVSSEEYEEELTKLNLVHAFNSPKFAMLNNLWVDEIHFLLLKTNKVELAITFGERNHRLLSPWSAPFGGFAFRDEKISLELLSSAISKLMDYVACCNCTSFSIILPPIIYASKFLQKLSFLLHTSSPSTVDINYYFNLESKFSYDYNSNFKRNLRKGADNSLQLFKCETDEDKQVVYDLIENQRQILKIPLKMGLSQIIATSRIIDIDFFLLSNSKQNYASAICYRVTSKIVQMIYWADEPTKRGSGAMYQLSMQLKDYYIRDGFSIFDLGPASENGNVNFGLTAFKEGIGCEVSLKNSYTFEINE